MIESSTYTSSYRAQGDDRTAGYMPVYGGNKSADADHFSKLVGEASSNSETTETAATSENSSHHHFSFLEFIKGLIDIINPLQHIPVISTIYRHLTGDEISPVARIAGDALYGGPIGAAVAVANVAVEHSTGKDIGENMMAMVTGHKGGDKAPETAIASAQAATQVASAAPITKLSDIVWNTPPVDDGAENAKLALLMPRKAPVSDATEIPTPRGPAPTKLSYRTGFGIEPLSDSTRGSKVHSMEAATTPRAGSKLAGGLVNVKPALHSQEAPADMAQNRAVPPELIAQKMMQGLDQYAAMKTMQIQQGTYAAF